MKALREAKAYVRLHRRGVPPKGDPRELLAALVEAVEAAPTGLARSAGWTYVGIRIDDGFVSRTTSEMQGQRVRVLAVGEDG